MARLMIRIDLGQNVSFGPGKAQLLELINETGSIRRAATAMKMSYRRAWLLLQEIDASIGTPAISTQTGGAQGGGSCLTNSGRKMLDCYRSIEKRATQSVVVHLRRMSHIAKAADKQSPPSNSKTAGHRRKAASKARTKPNPGEAKQMKSLSK